MGRSQGEVYVRMATYFSGCLIILFGVGVLIYQGVLWLQQGVWSALEVRNAYRWALSPAHASEPSFTWLGIQKVTLLALAAPLSGAAVVVGFLVISMATTDIAKYIAAVLVLVYIAAVIVT